KENAQSRQKHEPTPQKSCHHRTFRNSRKTVSARPILATSGNAVSVPFSRFVPLTSSYPFGTWRPYSVVPSELKSIRKNRWADGLFSRRGAVAGVNRGDSTCTFAHSEIGPRRQNELGVDEEIAFAHVAVGIGQELHLPLGRGIANLQLGTADHPFDPLPHGR